MDNAKIRPREHVRDDAGYSSSTITDKRIDIKPREQHRSARKETISDEKNRVMKHSIYPCMSEKA